MNEGVLSYVIILRITIRKSYISRIGYEMAISPKIR